jgi:hypothetical protein
LSFVAAKIQQNCTAIGNYNSKATRQGIICVFDRKKLKKPPSKVAQKNSNPLVFPYFPDCPNDPNRRIHVTNCGL